MKKEYVNAFKKDLLELIKQTKDSVLLTKDEAKKDVKNADLEAKIAKETKTLKILERSLNMANDSMNVIESESQARKEVEKLTAALENHAKIDDKQITIMSMRRLSLNGKSLQNKDVVKMPNNTNTKRAVSLGLVKKIG